MATTTKEDLRLWYERPAVEWEEALAIGNGRLGAMVFGGVEAERLQLNEDTLYADEAGRRDLDLDITTDFDRVVRMVRGGRNAEADAFITEHWLGRAQTCYQPLGDLRLNFDATGEVTDYVRELDIARAVCRVRITRGGATFTREIFASHPDQVIVIRLTAEGGTLDFTAALDSPHPTATVEADGEGTLIMRGQLPGLALRRELDWVENKPAAWKYPELWEENGQRKPNAAQVLYGADIDGRGMFFDSRLHLTATGGTVSAGEGELVVRGAAEVVMVLSAASSFNGFDKSPSRDGVDPAIRAAADLTAAAGRPFDSLLSRHVADYTALFDRVSLDVGRDPGRAALPTDERIRRFTGGGDPSLAALYFQFARYLMISGSRAGTQPLNLQGIWNPHVLPPWAGGYTMNINAEMNYWPVEVANLSECHEPLLRMIGELAVTGGEVARHMYGRRGWVAHHNTTLWRGAQPVDNVAFCSYWPMAAGWLCEHLWEHYAFTGDEAFLAERAYPLMRSAAEFCLDWLVDDGHGRGVTPVSTSPENRFRYVDADGQTKTAGTSMGCTMDLGIIRELFGNCIRSAEILDVDADFRDQLADRLAALLPFQVGAKGQLQEWQHDYEEVHPEHRHVSHLYALHPSGKITGRGTPELFAAARRSLELRGDEATGWSMGWKINLWARLGDGNHAFKLLGNLIGPERTYPNMFDAHPPFQIDGNFGGAAGIAEMLLQSHEPAAGDRSAWEIHLLPALPGAWPNGRAAGLCARGGFEIDLTWEDGKLAQLTLLSNLGRPCTIRHGDHTVDLTTQPGQRLTLDADLQPR